MAAPRQKEIKDKATVVATTTFAELAVFGGGIGHRSERVYHSNVQIRVTDSVPASLKKVNVPVHGLAGAI